MTTPAICSGYAPRSGHPCDRAATEITTAGCVHEHIGDRPSCPFHAEQYGYGGMLCGDCLDSADPHECVLTAIARHQVTARSA